jgi:hypothetical protein
VEVSRDQQHEALTQDAIPNMSLARAPVTGALLETVFQHNYALSSLLHGYTGINNAI